MTMEDRQQARRDALEMERRSVLADEDEDEIDDTTPWCAGCGSMTRAGCDCGPIAGNE